MRILIDGMGGDHAPQEIVKGAIQAAREIDDTVVIIGAEDLIKAELDVQKWNGSNIEVVNATEVITNNESPAMAVRKKKDSTINRGMKMVKEGEADVFISWTWANQGNKETCHCSVFSTDRKRRYHPLVGLRC